MTDSLRGMGYVGTVGLKEDIPGPRKKDAKDAFPGKGVERKSVAPRSTARLPGKPGRRRARQKRRCVDAERHSQVVQSDQGIRLYRSRHGGQGHLRSYQRRAEGRHAQPERGTETRL